MVLPRGATGSGLTHTCLVVQVGGVFPLETGMTWQVTTIGGNESNRFMVTERKSSDALGFVTTTSDDYVPTDGYGLALFADSLTIPDPRSDGDNANATDIA